MDITDIEQLEEIASTAAPDVVRAFIESELEIGHITERLRDNPARVALLRDLVAEEPSDVVPSLADALQRLVPQPPAEWSS